ncbi:MAG: molybdopterin molybdotransferase MoeA [Desulfurococcales archaeon]|nr:molybdopterin molybdotransferase MoeA [Desulfurococcales archaeon]
MEDLVEVDEARRILSELLQSKLKAVIWEETLNSIGRISAGYLAAGKCYPNYPMALLDGCAVSSSHASKGSVLRVAGRLRPASRPIKLGDPEGECVWVDTGAPMPVGSDSVVPVEELEVTGDRVRVLGEVKAFRGVAFPCSDSSPHDPIIVPGEDVSANVAASLQSLGYHKVPVREVPKVCVGAVGDELVEPPECGDSSVCEVNRGYVKWLLHVLRIPVEDLGIVPDRIDAVESMIRRGVEAGCKLVVVSGGSSVGLSDYTAALAARGGRLMVSRVRLRPGRPTKIADLGGSVLLVLPGHPRSASSASEEVLRSALESVVAPSCPLGPVRARLVSEVRAGARRYRVPLALIPCSGGGPLAMPVSRESYMTVSWSLAEAEIALEPGEVLLPGDQVETSPYRRPSKKALDLADTGFTVLGGAKVLKTQLGSGVEVLKTSSTCKGLIVVAEKADYETAGIEGELIHRLRRGIYWVSKGDNCSLLAIPDLKAVEAIVSEGGYRQVIKTPRIASTLRLFEEGYVDCLAAPLTVSEARKLESSGFKVKRLGEEELVVLRIS